MVIENKYSYPKTQRITTSRTTTPTATTPDPKALMQEEIRKYEQQKISEGYTKNSNGELVKEDGNKTTIIKISESGDVDITERTTTPDRTETRPTSEFETIEKEIRKTERALKSASGQSYKYIEARLFQLYEARDNLANTGRATYTEVVKGETKEATTTNTGIIFIDNKGYSVAPELQKDFKAQVEATKLYTPQSAGVFAPRQQNQSETRNISGKIQIGDVFTPPKYSGTISARKSTDFAPFTNPTASTAYKTKLIQSTRDLPEAVQSTAIFGGSVLIGMGEKAINYYQNPVELAKTAGVGVGLTLLPEVFIPAVAIAGAGSIAYEVGQSKGIMEKGQVVGQATEDVAIMSGSALTFNTIKSLNTPFKSGNVKQSVTNTFGESILNPLERRGQFLTEQFKTIKGNTPFELQNINTKQRDLFGARATAQPEGTGQPTSTRPFIQYELPRTKDLITVTSEGTLKSEGTITEIKARVANLEKSNVLNPTEETPTIPQSNGVQTLLPRQKNTVNLFDTVFNPYTNKIELVKAGEVEGLGGIRIQPPAKSTATPEVKPTPLRNFRTGESTTRTSTGQQISSIYANDKGLRPSEAVSDATFDAELNLDIKGKVTDSWTNLKPLSTTFITSTRTSEVQQPRNIFNIQTQSKNILNTQTELQQEQRGGQEQRNNILLRLKTGSESRIIQGQTVEQKSQQNLKIAPIQIIGQRQVTKTVFTPVETPKPKDPEKKTPKIIIPTPTFTKSLFITKAKVKGKFVIIGKSRTLPEAFNRGKQFVQRTASATFKIESGNATVKPTNFLGRGFAPSKSVVGGIIQQRGFRIKSQGEKIEISAKGRIAQKKNRLRF